VFKSLPFEISAPTFAYPGLRPGVGAPRPFDPTFLTRFFSHSSELPLSFIPSGRSCAEGYLLSFDNHVNRPGGGVPIPTAPRRAAPLFRALAPLFHLLSILQDLSPVFPIACALFAENAGVYPSYCQSGNPARILCHSSQPQFSLCYNLQFISSEENS